MAPSDRALLSRWLKGRPAARRWAALDALEQRRLPAKAPALLELMMLIGDEEEHPKVVGSGTVILSCFVDICPLNLPRAADDGRV